MNDKELVSKVRSSMYGQCRSRGYAAPVDVLIDVGILSKQKCEEWRFGKVPFLEAVCNINLHKLSLVLRVMRQYASQQGLKASFMYYKRWGAKKHGHKVTIPLRFTKSGNPEIEKLYATHYVDPERVRQKEVYSKEEDDGDIDMRA